MAADAAVAKGIEILLYTMDVMGHFLSLREGGNSCL